MAALALILAAALPTATAVVLESTTLPIRVECEDEVLAAEALALSEALWVEQVEGMGFATPLMLDGDDSVVEGFALTLYEMSSGALATFEVQGDNPATPHSDCPVLSEINSLYMDQPGWMGMCISHLLNHASLHAVDCLEPQMPSFDTFSVAVEVLTGDGAFWDTYIEQYQAMPYESVDMWFRTAPSAYYQFGSSLFALFLDDFYGSGDGSLLAELWTHTAQDGTITGSSGELAYGDVDNEPDYLDAIDIGLQAHGASMDEAWIAFTASRWFVGANDDGAHISNAGDWTTGAPTVDATWTGADLPLLDQPAQQEQAEYSSSFVVFELEPSEDRDLLLELSGSAAIAWGGTALAIPAEGASTEFPVEMNDGASGSVRVPLDDGWERIVLAVAALSDGTHDPEDGDWYLDYTYSYGASVVDAEPAADTGMVDEPDDETCGCESTQGGAYMALLGLLAAGGLAVLRGRSSQRPVTISSSPRQPR
jgi:hypothetical protein